MSVHPLFASVEHPGSHSYSNSILVDGRHAGVETRDVGD